MPEGKDLSGGKEIQVDLAHSPWDSLTQDLEVLWILTQDPKVDESRIQTIISNYAAVDAVKKGWLVVRKDVEEKFSAFTTPSWEAERRRQNAPIPREAKKPHKTKLERNTQERGAIKFEEPEKRNGNGKKENGNGVKERSPLNFLSRYEELDGRWLVDARSHKVTIFVDRGHTGIEKEFTGSDQEVLAEMGKYVLSKYK